MITAVIAVRAGSQRVKNKNIKPFGNSNLLEMKIKTLKMALTKLQNKQNLSALEVIVTCMECLRLDGSTLL